MTPDTTSGLARLAVALLIGLLIGLDRERAETRKHREGFAGVRTFPLIALAGCIPMLVADVTGPWLVVASFVAVAALIVIAYRNQAQAGHVGATTEAAGIAAFLLGVVAGSGRLQLAGAAGIAVAVLLVAKPKLEGFSRAISKEELAATLELAVISVIVLPLLPDVDLGPWDAFNPREMWLVVVLVAGLSFVGFVATRVVGETRGLAIAGAIGGLASSTAVTLAMSERSRETESLSHAAAAATVLASAVMAVRVGVLAVTIDNAILPRVLPLAIAMALAGAIAAWFIAHAYRGKALEVGERLRNPFSLRQAVVFGVVYSLILLGVRAAQEYLGDRGVYAAALLGALADVDAVTVAFTQLGPGDSAWRTPAAAIAVAAVTNTLVKLGIGWVRGSATFRRDTVLGLGAMAVAGVAAGMIVYSAG